MKVFKIGDRPVASYSKPGSERHLEHLAELQRHVDVAAKVPGDKTAYHLAVIRVQDYMKHILRECGDDVQFFAGGVGL